MPLASFHLDASNMPLSSASLSQEDEEHTFSNRFIALLFFVRSPTLHSYSRLSSHLKTSPCHTWNAAARRRPQQEEAEKDGRTRTLPLSRGMSVTYGYKGLSECHLQPFLSDLQCPPLLLFHVHYFCLEISILFYTVRGWKGEDFGLDSILRRSVGHGITYSIL